VSLFHRYKLYCRSVGKRIIGALFSDVSENPIEPLARQCRDEFCRLKAVSLRVVFTSLEEQPTDSSSSPIRPNEECPNPRRLVSWIQKFGFTSLLLVATEECLAAAPTAACNDTVRFRLHNIVCAVADELSIDVSSCADGCFNLRIRVVFASQNAGGFCYQSFENGNVVKSRLTH